MVRKSDIVVGAVIVIVALLLARGVVGNIRRRADDLNGNSGVSPTGSSQLPSHFLNPAAEQEVDGTVDTGELNTADAGVADSDVGGVGDSGEFDSSTLEEGISHSPADFDASAAEGVSYSFADGPANSGDFDDAALVGAEEGVSATAGDGSIYFGQLDSASPVGAELGVSPSTAVAGDVEGRRPIDCFIVASAPGGVEEIPCSSNEASTSSATRSSPADFFMVEIGNSSGSSAVNSSASSSGVEDIDGFVLVENEEPTTGGSTGGVKKMISSIFKIV